MGYVAIGQHGFREPFTRCFHVIEKNQFHTLFAIKKVGICWGQFSVVFKKKATKEPENWPSSALIIIFEWLRCPLFMLAGLKFPIYHFLGDGTFMKTRPSTITTLISLCSNAVGGLVAYAFEHRTSSRWTDPRRGHNELKGPSVGYSTTIFSSNKLLNFYKFLFRERAQTTIATVALGNSRFEFDLNEKMH